MRETPQPMMPKLPIAVLCAALALALPALGANVCSNPGKDGPGAPTGIPNSYYPGVSVAAGSTSIPVGAIDTSSGGAATPIAAGDLVLVMQMQDADISSSNDSFYGGSSTGSGELALNNSGMYEYASVSLGYAGGSPIVLTAPLKNPYRTAAYAAGANGQRTFQVIRVPQFGAAALAGTVTGAPWNGSTGGVVAFDVAGQLNWNSQIIDVTGCGFRGGAGLYLKGAGATQTPFSVNDYASSLSPLNPTISPNPSSANGPFPGAHASKGEGIAGTPRYLFVPATAGAATNGSGAVFDNGVEGYPNGSLARGAPGNAGGGGTDGDPTPAPPNGNGQNTGGGGGGGYSSGGLGGYGWTPNPPPGSKTGGFGGAGVPLSAARLTLGGGGGAGSTNNGTGTPTYGLASSGAPGGGIVLVRARTIIGTGTINANGTSGNQTVCHDASGGGGGGGAVLVFASNNSGNVGNLTINASGGTGGSNTGNGSENSSTCGAYNQNPHGPGGGGGGGFAALSSSSNAAINVAGSMGGTTSPSPTSTSPYGSSASPGGFQISSVLPTDLPGAMPSSLCYPVFTTTKTTSKANTVQGGTTSYTVTVSNAAGYGTGTGVSLSDLLPAPFTVATTDTVTLANGAARGPVVNPAAGATSPAWGTFTIPGGGSVALSFTANIPVATALATYQNPANISYDDPTRSAAGQTVTPGGTYAAGGFVLGSNYNSSSSTLEDVTVRAPATLVKSFNPVSIAASGTSVLSIAITNPNGSALTGAGFSDAFPSGLTATGGAVTVSGAGCTGFAPATITAGATAFSESGGTIPASSACTLSVSVSAATGASYLNTLPTGALIDALNVTNIAAASATLLARPTIAKSFAPAAVPASTDDTLTFTLANPNAAQALTGTSFTDPFPSGLFITGGAVTVTGAGCTGFAPATLLANATSFTLTAGTLPAGGSCTVAFAVRSNSQGSYPNTAGGVTTTQTVAPGAPSNTASLGVGVIGVSKSFAPTLITSGGTSTVTLNLSNPTLVAQIGAALSDTLTGMAISAAQSVGGTCTGVTPSALAAGQTSLSFTGISIPAAGCTLTFLVSSSTAGTQANTSSGVSTTLLPLGPASNTATLTVAAPPTIAKAFNPTVIQTGGSSTITFTVSSGDSIPLTNASFTDVLNGNLAVAGSGAIAAGGTCAGASSNSFTAGTAGATLVFAGLTIPTGAGGCTVTLPVTSSTVSPAAGWPNRTSGVSSTEAPTGLGSAIVNLIVAGAPTITKSFGSSPIAQGGTSTVTFTLSSPSAIALTSAAFTDPLINLQIAAAGAAGGTCVGAASNSFAAGQSGTLSFSGITIPAAPGACTVTVVVTSISPGQNPNTASGVTTAQTPLAGSGSSTVNLTVDSPPQLSVGFSPGLILASTASATSNSTLTITMTNSNTVALTGVAFTDTLSNLQIYATGSAGGSCAGASGNSFTAGNTSLSFTGLTIPAGGSCTVTVAVASANLSPVSGWPDSTSGATSAQTPSAGPPSGVATLGVVSYATVTKSFSPNAIVTNGVSTITFLLTNPNAISLTSATFSDTFPANMTTSGNVQNFIGGPGRGSCTGAIPSADAGGANNPSVAFSGILLPGNSSCTVTVDITVGVTGSYTNTSTGIGTNETGPLPGPASNGATLGAGKIGISKAFAPATVGIIGSGPSDVSTLTFSLTNSTAAARNGIIVFTDGFPAGMVIATPLTTTNSCGGTLLNAANTAASVAGDTGISLQNGTLALGASCAITVGVTTNAAGNFANTTSTVSWGATAARTGPPSNTAVLVVVLKPVIAKVFSPTAVDTYRSSTLTFTLGNSNASAPLTGCSFTDALKVQLAAAGSGTVGASGTCAGASSNTFTAGTYGATLSFTGLTIPSAGSCTVTLPITSTTAGSYTNTSSGVLCSQLVSAGAVSNTAPVTFNKLPLQFMKSASLVTVPPGNAVTYTLTYMNPNPGMSLQNIFISDTTPKYTSFSSATCGVLPSSLTGCSIVAPAVGAAGAVTWTLSGTLDPGATGSVTLTVIVN